MGAHYYSTLLLLLPLRLLLLITILRISEYRESLMRDYFNIHHTHIAYIHTVVVVFYVVVVDDDFCCSYLCTVTGTVNCVVSQLNFKRNHVLIFLR